MSVNGLTGQAVTSPVTMVTKELEGKDTVLLFTLSEALDRFVRNFNKRKTVPNHAVSGCEHPTSEKKSDG